MPRGYTEVGLIHRLKLENPDMEFVPLLGKALCSNMKLVTLEKIACTMRWIGCSADD